jgi:hypothetical protein
MVDIVVVRVVVVAWKIRVALKCNHSVFERIGFLLERNVQIPTLIRGIMNIDTSNIELLSPWTC